MSKRSEAIFDLPCIIFAGGKSSRMGRNKALLPFGGFPTLAEYQYARLAPHFTSTLLSVKSAADFPEGMPLIIDDPVAEDFAPTAGFLSAFRTLKVERIFVLSVDTPFVDETVVAALLDADRPGIDAVVARTGHGVHPLCGIYHRRLLPHFETMSASGEHTLGKLLRSCNVAYVDFGEEVLFANLNHPHEYAEALETLRRRQQ